MHAFTQFVFSKYIKYTLLELRKCIHQKHHPRNTVVSVQNHKAKSASGITQHY